MSFFFNDTATTEIYTLSLHDALPISHADRPDVRDDLRRLREEHGGEGSGPPAWRDGSVDAEGDSARSEEHTSELQSRQYLACRLLLEKKKNTLLKHNDYTNT